MEKQPTIVTLEKPPVENIKTKPVNIPEDHRERKLNSLKTNGENVDKNENLKHAQEFLLNEKIYSKFLKANIDINNGNKPNIKIDILNNFIETLQNSTDAEIDSIIRQFNINFKHFVTSHTSQYNISADLHRKIFENDLRNNREARGNIQAEGIKNVINFIRARKQLHSIGVKQEYAFYVQHELDGVYKIDLIECIFENGVEGLHISEMNLIQIKSSEPDQEEKEKIFKDHKEWAAHTLMNAEDLEKEFTEGIPKDLTIESIAENSDNIQFLLLEILTDPLKNGVLTPQEWLQKFGLESDKVSIKHKAWLLREYGQTIREQVAESIVSGETPEDKGQAIIKTIQSLEDSLSAKAGLPKKTATIGKINSIIAVGAKILSNRVILDAKSDTQKLQSKIVKYN